MTNERIPYTAKLRSKHENVSRCARRNILAVSAVGGTTFLLLLLAAASYAQTVRTVDAQAFVTSPLPAKQTAAAEDDSIRPFHINIPEEQIVELRKRIAATRWPDKETVSDESQAREENHDREQEEGIEEEGTANGKSREDQVLAYALSL
jgi:hypothetical protein